MWRLLAKLAVPALLRSVDRYLVGEFCVRAGARVTTWPVSNSTEFAAQMMVCNTSAAFVLFTWINGVS